MKGNHNSLAETFLALLLGLLSDVQRHNSTYYSLRDCARDYEYIKSRTLAEGVSFLTKTLPLLDIQILRGLESGTFVAPSNFKIVRSFPLIFRGLLMRVFDSGCSVVADVDITCLNDLRQILGFFKKVNIGMDEHRTSDVIAGFVEVDRSLPSLEELSYTASRAIMHARSSLERLFEGFDPYDIVPRHGPGAVSDRRRPHMKRRPLVRYQSLDAHYPLDDYFYTTLDDYIVRSQSDVERVEATGTARLVLVPKDSKGPRVISCEPAEIQFIQQGLMSKLYKWIESHRMTSGFVNFTDQTVNNSAAIKGSMDGITATIDLKDASDRVSLRLVQSLFPKGIYDCLVACRSTHTELPDGSLLELKKFAPQGSALCFPIEALVFFFLARGLHWTRYGSLNKFSLLVYGDDLIADKLTTELILKYFSQYGLRVNEDKTYKDGKFRESCGVDAYNGVDITPIRLREMPTQLATMPARAVSCTATRNLLWARCYYDTASVLENVIQRQLKSRLPVGLPGAGYICVTSARHSLPLKGMRYSKTKCAYITRALVTKVVDYRKDDLDGLTDDREYFRKHTQGWSPEYTPAWYTVRNSVKLVKRKVVAFA